MIFPRPHLHFTPPHDWMNDPNGLVHHNGLWHLFYQAQPAAEKEKRWGHATSSDLMTWQNLPDALLPDELGAIWSGSAVCDTNNTSGFFPNSNSGGLVAIFTHRRLRTGEKQTQSQSLAYSRDDGQTWTKYANNPVLSHSSPDFRDPKVFWHAPTGAWVMIVSAGHEVELYRSPNLTQWTLASRWGAGLMPGLVWECPDLFSLPDGNGGEKWLLLSSFLDMNNFKGHFAPCFAAYFVGTFDGHAFVPDTDSQSTAARRVDFGPDNYAPVTFAGAPGGRRVLVGWLNHWGYAGNLDTRPWQGQMTVPRELQWTNDALIQTTPPEWEAAHVLPRREWRGEPLTVDPAREALEVIVPTAQTASFGAWSVEARQNGTLLWSLCRTTGNVWEFVRGASGGLPPLKPDAKLGTQAFWCGKHTAPVRDARAEVRLLLDTCSVEAFCDNGETVFSAQVFGASSKTWEITFKEAV